MHSLVSTIETNRESRGYTAAVFLDISGAFDGAWPAEILAALTKRKCPLYLIDIIASLLKDRTAIIKTNQGLYKCSIQIGCPQGGVLSPFLWIILVEELISMSYPFPYKIIGYAGDIAIVCWHKVFDIAISNLQLIANDTVAKCDRYLLDINALKTILMIFSNKRTIEPCNFKIKENIISPSATSKFVGFELDTKLSWKSHIEEKCRATQRQIHILRRCLRRTWGLDTKKLVTLYKTIIVPKLLYGCSVWCRVILIKSYKTKLQTVQRSMLKCITRSLKNVPLNSLLIISNFLPIELKILEFSVNYYLSHKHVEFSPSSAATIGAVLHKQKLDQTMDSTRKFHSRSHPPWELSKLNYRSEDESTLPPEENGLAIYTKSHKSTAGVGLGIVCCASKVVVQTAQEKLAANTTENQAEILGLLAALQYAVANKSNYTSCNIFCKSVPALKDCTKNEKLNEAAITCRKLCYDNRDHIHLNLVAKEAEGIDLAKEAAKAVLDLGSQVTKDQPWSIELLKDKIKTEIQKLWSDEWAGSKTGTHTRRFFPRPSDASCLNGSYIHQEITQVLTGHCRLNHHLHLIKTISSPQCECGHGDETVEHFLFHCARYASQRSHLIQACSSSKKTFPPSLEDIPKFRHIWKEFKDFILKTERLK
jgi:ribonuclease HI